MKRIRLILLAFVASLMSAAAVLAAPITFLHETLDASGTLDGNVFGVSQVRITATGDTDNRQAFGSGWFIDHDSVTIQLDNLVLTVNTPTRTFVNNNQQLVGFSRAGISGADLVNGPNNAQFGVWDMTTSIGPVEGVMRYLQWSNIPQIETDQGILIFNSSQTRGRFAARVGDDPPAVPLPAAGWMLLAGMGGLGAMRKFRKGKT